MNKFDDMMAMLAAESKDFQQIIAIDQDFELFTRAWCVAELDTASEMGMSQTVKVYSRYTLDKNVSWLKNLDIRKMQATRPEDKADILAKIKDIPTFNSMMQSLLLEKLFPAWHSMGMTDQMNCVGRIARWQHVAKQGRLEDIWDVLGPRGACHPCE